MSDEEKPKTFRRTLPRVFKDEEILSIACPSPLRDKTALSGHFSLLKVPYLPVPLPSIPADTRPAPYTTYPAVPAVGSQTAIGRDTQTDQLISISDIDRRTGLYILGKSGMGKSWLLVNLMLQDIERGHGLVFIDPHGNAIDELLERVCSARPKSRYEECLLFDPEYETHSFGINILRCSNIASINERQNTYTRAKGVFDKIWKNAYFELPLLQKVVEHAIYAFIENQEYTLGDVPLFLTDRAFREHIVSNIRYNLRTADFWRRFAPREAEAALTRLDTLLGHPYVNDIVSQRETTIDFSKFIEEKRIVVFKLSDRLSTDVKTFIGTILISELVDAVKRRQAANPHQFGVYVDEFQNFSSYDDFATLITGGRKYGVATTIAHQERYGQFAEDRDILGATDASGNKICFQLSVRDAEERAADFSEAPPTETKREQELVITPNPVNYLLDRGHKNPDISRFVNKYLRSMQYKREDAKEDMEGERLRRMMYLDEAGIYSVDERLESLESNDEYVRGHFLDARRAALVRAQAQTGLLLNLFDISKNLRLTMRGLNGFLNAIMERRISCGQEAFSDFLVSLVHGYSGVAGEYMPALELYITLRYGEAKTARQVPLALARTRGLFARSVEEALQDVEYKRQDKMRKFMKKDLYFYTFKDRLKSVQAHIAEWRLEEISKYTWRVKDVVSDYLYLERYPQVREWLWPYVGAEFKTAWKGIIPNRGQFSQLCNSLAGLADLSQEIAVDRSLITRLTEFLQHKQEGAFVVLTLVKAARFPQYWTALNFGRYSDTYPGVNMLDLPAIAGKEALEIFLVIKKINEYLLRQDAKQDLVTYFYIEGKPMEEEIRWNRRDGGRNGLFRDLTRSGEYLLSMMSLLEETEKRIDMQLLRHECDRRNGWLRKNLSSFEMLWWGMLDEGERLYLLVRACDIAIYGVAVADRAWPQPELAGLSPGRISWVVALLTILLTDVRREVEIKAFEVPLGDHYSSELIPLPTHLPPRVLDSFDKQALQEACQEELLKADQETQGVVATINDFARFCQLLAEPENHIKAPCGQYVEREVPARHEQDMVNQRARELLELPKYTAYGKVLQEADGEPRVWKGKIQTLKLKETTDDYILQMAAKVSRSVIEATSMLYLKRREWIAEESALRQVRWRGRAGDEPPAAQSESKTDTVEISESPTYAPPSALELLNILRVPKEPSVVAEDEPPPSHS